MQNVINNLRAAAEVIERQGWVVGPDGMMFGDSPKCALGAIAQVTETEVRPSLFATAPGMVYEYERAERTEEAQALIEWIESNGYPPDIPSWNDASTETAVLTAFRNLANHLDLVAGNGYSPWDDVPGGKGWDE